MAEAGLVIGVGADAKDVVADQNGAFRVLVPHNPGDDRVHVIAWDRLSTLFDGIVRMGVGVTIVCDTSPMDEVWDILGVLNMPSLASEDRWVATLWKPAVGRGVPRALATTECYGPLMGDRASVRMRFMDSGNWMHEGAVVLCVYLLEGDRRRSSIGAMAYESLAHFTSQLQRGITMHCPLRSFRVDRVHGEDVKALAFLMPGQGFTAVTMLGEGGVFAGRLPEGQYYVRGVVDQECWGEALVDLSLTGNAKISWDRQFPGGCSLRIAVESSSGEQVAGAKVSFIRVGKSTDVLQHGEVLANESGVAELVGIVPGAYALEIVGGGESTHVEASIPEDRALAVRLGRSVTVDVRLVGISNVGMDAIKTSDCRVYYRLSEGPWRKCVQDGFASSQWTITGVPVGSSVSVSVKGDGWGGGVEAECRDVKREVVQVPVSAVYPLEGLLVGGSPDDEVALAYGGVVMPWNHVQVSRQGEFVVYEVMDARLSDPELIVYVNGVAVMRQTIDASVNRPLRVQMKR